MIGKLEWPHLHADLVAKRDALNSVIAVVEQHFIGDTPDAMPASPVQAAKAKTRAKGPMAVPDDRGIVAMLKKHGGSMSPRDLAAALKLATTSTLAYHLKPLLKAKRVIATGTTIDRRVSLPARSDDKEEP